MAGTPAKKNNALTVNGVIRDSDGDAVTTGTLTSILIQDGVSKAGATPTVIASGGGVLQLVIPAVDMNFDIVTVILQSSTLGSKPFFMTIYTTSSNLDDIATSVSLIGTSSGSAIPFSAQSDNTGAPIKGATFNGTVASGTFATTASNGATYHNITDAALIDIVYQFNVGGSKQATAVNITFVLNGNNDSCTLQAYNFTGAVWETIDSFSGSNNSTNVNVISVLFPKYTGTGSDLGDVLIRFVCTATSPSLFVGILTIQAVSVIDSAGYGGKISVNTIGGGSNGSDPQINGTIDNPVILMSDVDLLLAAKNFIQIDVQGNSSITLGTAQIARIFTGFNWSLALGGQDITNTFIEKAIISGTGTSTSGVVRMDECRLQTCTLPPVMAFECGFLAGTVITAGQAGTYTWFQGHNMDTFTSSVTFDFNRVVNTVGVVKMQWKPGYGSITIKNMKSTDECSIYGEVRLIIDSTNNQGGLINADKATITDNVAGGFTGTLVTAVSSDKSGYALSGAALISINAEVDNALDTVIPGSPTAGSVNERLKAIDDKLPTGTLSDFDPVTDIVANVTTIANNSDKTGYSISGTKTTLDALNDTSALAFWNTLLTSISTVGSIGLRFKQLLGLTITGTVDTATFAATVISFETDLNETTADHFNGRLLIFRGGALDGQQTDITDYVFSGNSKGKFTVTGITEAPANGQAFEVV